MFYIENRNRIRSSKLILVIISLLANVLLTQAQDPYAVHYTTKEGLPTNTIYSSIIAKNGVQWFGSNKGLFSFDGVKFRMYPTPSNKGKSLTNLVEDYQGRIWSHNFAGQLFCWDKDSLYLDRSWEQQQLTRNVKFMSIQNDAYLYVQDGKSSPTVVYDLQTQEIRSANKRVQPLHQNIDISYVGIGAFEVIDGEKKTKISCKDCFKMDVPYSNSIMIDGYFVNKNKISFFLYNWVNHMNYSNQYGVLKDLSIDSIAFVYKLENNKLNSLYFPPCIKQFEGDCMLIELEIENDSIIWLGTSRGLFKWNIYSNKAKYFFKEKTITAINVDSEHNYWISTSGDGLYQVSDWNDYEYLTNTSISGVSKLEVDSLGKIAMVTENNHFQYYDIKANDALELVYDTAVNSKMNTLTYQYSTNNFFINAAKIAYFFDPQNYKLIEISFIAGLRDFAICRQGRLVMANYTGVMIERRDTQSRLIFDQIMNNNLSVETKIAYVYDNGRRRNWNIVDGTSRVYSVLVQEQDSTPYTVPYTIWYAGTNGLKYMQGDTEFEITDAVGEKIIGRDLLLEGRDSVWVATLEQGLYLICRNKIIQHYDQTTGLPSNNISKLLQNEWAVWGLTDKGIFRRDKKTGAITIWSKDNTLLPIENIIDMALFNNRLWITNGEKLLAIALDKQPKKTFPTIAIAGVIISDSSYIIRSEKYELESHQNTIKIKFRGISHFYGANFKYHYRLAGLEKNWNTSSSSNNQINYPELAAGDYIFEVKIVTPDGQASEIARLSFYIAKPFYLRWWFLVLVGLIAGVFVWWQFKLRLSKLEKQNDQKLEQAATQQALRLSELKAIKAQLNPHFIFNVLNSIQEYIITNERELASDYLGKFADLMRMYLQHSQKGVITLDEEIEALEIYMDLEAVRFDGALDFSIVVGNDVIEEEVEVPVLLLQPYVENAIRHGLFYRTDNRKLLVEIKLLDSNTLQIKIEDNGIGRAESGRINQQKNPNHQSFATSANNTRLGLINYTRIKPILLQINDLMTEQGEATGTQIVLTIPLEE